MTTFLDMLWRVSLFVVLGVPGFILARLGKIKESGRGAITALLLYVAMPALVLLKLLETDVRALNAADVALAALMPFVMTALLWGVCRAVFRKADGVGGVCALCATFSNCGFLGIPLAEALYPDRPEITVLLSVFNISATFLLFTAGTVMLCGKRRQGAWRALLSPLNGAVLLGLALSFFGVGAHLAPVLPILETLASMTTPLAMTVLGALCATLSLKALCGGGRAFLAVGIKLVVAPLLGMGVLALLKYGFSLPVGGDIASAVFLGTAVGTAASAPSMAEVYGGDPHQGAVLTVASTLLCPLTLPLLYLLFVRLFLS